MENGVMKAWLDLVWQGDGPVDNFVAIYRALEAVQRGGNVQDYAEALDAFILGENDLEVEDRQNAVNELRILR